MIHPVADAGRAEKPTETPAFRLVSAARSGGSPMKTAPRLHEAPSVHGPCGRQLPAAMPVKLAAARPEAEAAPDGVSVQVAVAPLVVLMAPVAA